MLILTSVFASIFTVMLVWLSFAVIRLRRANKVGIGNGGHEALERASRAQGNFAEYVPFGMMLLACLELNGAPGWLVTIPGLVLFVGRWVHAKGITEPAPHFRKRVLGMALTINTLMALVVLNLGWSAFKSLH